MTKAAKKRAIRKAREAGQPYQAQEAVVGEAAARPPLDMDAMDIEPPGPLNWGAGGAPAVAAGGSGGEAGERVESVGEVRRRHRAEAKAEERAVAELLRAKAGLSARDKAEKAERRKLTKQVQARRAALAARHQHEMEAARARRDRQQQ